MSSDIRTCGDQPYWYDKNRPLGTGSHGDVFEGGVKGQDWALAVKVVDLRRDPSMRQAYDTEHKVLHYLRHAHFNHIPTFIHSFECRGIGYVITERLDDTLHSYLSKCNNLDSEFFNMILTWLVTVIEDLRSLGVRHRDIKLSNIMYKRIGHSSRAAPKLIDFGLAEFIEPSDEEDGLFVLDECVFMYNNVYKDLCSIFRDKAVLNAANYAYFHDIHDLFPLETEYWDAREDEESHNYWHKQKARLRGLYLLQPLVEEITKLEEALLPSNNENLTYVVSYTFNGGQKNTMKMSFLELQYLTKYSEQGASKLQHLHQLIRTEIDTMDKWQKYNQTGGVAAQ